MIHKINGKPENVIKAIEENIIGFKAYRNKEILKDHYVYGFTLEYVAEKYDMSVSQIKKICYDNERIIISSLRAEK